MNDVTKMEFFGNSKDRTPLFCQFNIVYEFFALDVQPTMLIKNGRTFNERTNEHAWTDKDSVDYSSR